MRACENVCSARHARRCRVSFVQGNNIPGPYSNARCYHSVALCGGSQPVRRRLKVGKPLVGVELRRTQFSTIDSASSGSPSSLSSRHLPTSQLFRVLYSARRHPITMVELCRPRPVVRANATRSAIVLLAQRRYWTETGQLGLQDQRKTNFRSNPLCCRSPPFHAPHLVHGGRRPRLAA